MLDQIGRLLPMFYRYYSHLSCNRCGGWQQRQFPYSQIEFCNWAKNEGYEGDTCARMQGNGINHNRDTVLWSKCIYPIGDSLCFWFINKIHWFLGKWRDTVCTKSTRHCTLCQIQNIPTNFSPSYDPSVPFHALPSYHSRVNYDFHYEKQFDINQLKSSQTSV